MENGFAIYVIEEVIYAQPYEYVGGGDMHTLYEVKTKKSAMNKAIKASFMEKYGSAKVYEIWMERLEDGDVAEQWAIKNGKITLHSVCN